MHYKKKFSKDEPPWSYPRTFFLESERWIEPYILNVDESHHLTKVLRIQKNEEIYVLDGRGREGRFLVYDFCKNIVQLSLVEERVFSEPINKVILAVAWTKTIRRNWLFEKAVELGAWGLWLWKADHSQIKIIQEHKKAWLNQIVSGAKQCRNPWFPSIEILSGGVNDIIFYANKLNCSYRHIFVENTYGPAEVFMPNMLQQTGIKICVIGPEGGFSVKEVQILKDAEFLPITLGKRVLRWETAAILCLGLHWWGNSLLK